MDTYTLLDEGSSVTLIDDDIIQSLNLKGETRQLNVQWFGGKSARDNTTVVSLQISGTGKSMRHLDRLISRSFGYSTEDQKLWSRNTICSRHQTWMGGVWTD